MTSDSSNWSTLCIVGRSSGLEETHWIATESNASRLSACTPSHCWSTISLCLFSVTRKFNCIKGNSGSPELLDKKNCSNDNSGYVVMNATILHGKLHDKNGIHCYQAIEINHTLKKKKRLSQETMDINQISLHQLFLQKKTLEVRFSDAFSSTFCTISYQINWNNVIHSSHTRLLLVKINGVGTKKKCFKVELIFQFSWRSMPVVPIIPGTS